MLNRRQFVSTVAAGAAATAAASAIEACGLPSDPGSAIVGPPTVTIPLPAVGQTVGVDGIGQAGQGIAVTRLSVAQVVAVSRQCTHAACKVNLPAVAGGTLDCPCHASVFTVEGAVVSGPAPASLRPFTVAVNASTNQVIINNS